MREIRQLIYATIRTDSTYQSLTGATAQDPRIYLSKPPVYLAITDDKKGFSVYYQMGSTHIGGTEIIHGTSKNNYTYGLEIFGKDNVTVSSIGARVEKLFENKPFQTSSYVVGYTFVTRGSVNFDDTRQLYLETLMIHLNKIIALIEAS
jgi:hypothetical protein